LSEIVDNGRIREYNGGNIMEGIWILMEFSLAIRVKNDTTMI
jgi:hypothetical protein